jgi:lysophospholipase L1-like esterase
MKKIISLAALILIMAFNIYKAKKTTIFIAGDSTASIKETKALPETGWGMPFVYFWDTSTAVINKAKNGRSTSSFRNEGLWKQIIDSASEGDFIFIQFGHNDEVPTKKTATPPAEFKLNLKNYITDAKAKKCTPILLTPMARRKFNTQGNVEGTHDEYAQIIRVVSQEESVVLFDMDKLTQNLYQEMGVEKSKLLFLHLKPNEHPNYPEGKEDNTHFSELGARLVAQLVLQQIKLQLPQLAAKIVVYPKK